MIERVGKNMDEKFIQEALECENPYIAGMYIWKNGKQAREGFEEITQKKKQESCEVGLVLFDGYASFYGGNIAEAQKKAYRIFQDRKNIKNNETAYIQCLGAAYLLELMARHGLEEGKWKEAENYIEELAKDQSVSRRCREAAQLYGAMSSMALAMMSKVPMWIRNKEFGVCCIHGKPYYGEKSIHPGNLATAFLTSAQYLSYVGQPIESLNVIEEAQQIYHLDHNSIFFTYLEILKAANYGQLQLLEEMKESLEAAIKCIASEKLWLIIAEFAEDFGRDTVNEILSKYCKEGTAQVDRLADGFRQRLNTLHKTLEIQNKTLTNQERKILYLMADGYSDTKIAEELHLARGTVKSHMRNAYAKMGIDKNVKIKDALAMQDVQAVWMKK
ncbi:MAG: response regulator transcription factor [Clostridia bacterium]|nr:response regulator transcription factor [Clostridia bacterium]NCC44245.1 response regulator transcription factor [Clostridia bacterium]